MQHNPRFLQLVESVRTNIRECSIADLKLLLEKKSPVLLFDVREDHEWVNGHIPTAKHLGRGIIERDIETLIPDPETEIYLYCGGGFRSALAADTLQKMGYMHVISVDGGFRGWKESGGEIVTPSA
ncbi:Rhodanese domain protein [Planctopirus limnophila DSM 3776]|uniref:Rhodanese domain protein n=1 Tax=Planctopirus limnophila (strain ATCC 43296 / DSM 3776 / IFAM 1008 / Mu 290) TaxID=521674 RepID=D5SY56_PLAL2|nr:rhodanese-like domain-containing protein [Planctopirus limnophila]ADG69849.1 Rhodanese domain protein [Planctopirus limnophila DSM 3776]